MKKHFFIVSIFAGLFLSSFFVSCEKDELEVNKACSKKTDLNGYIDISYYKNHSGIKSNEIDPPYYFVWQYETTIQLEDECACLRTDSGDCLWEVGVVATKENTDIYSLFLEYYNNTETKAFFEKEKWFELFPMLQEITINRIINEELIIGHTKPHGSEISYFYFSLPGTDHSDSNNILFTLQLNIE